MEYGAISLFAGIIFLYQFYSSNVMALRFLKVSYVSILLIRFSAVLQCFSKDWRKWNKTQDDSRFMFLISRIFSWFGTMINKVRNVPTQLKNF